MAEIVLLDCRDEETVHVLDSDTGASRPCHRQTIRDQGIAGYAAWKSVGLFRRRRVFVAAFSDHRTLMLRIEDGRYDLGHGDAHAECKLVAPFVREFTLVRVGQPVFSCVYWHTGARVWPDDGDIFALIGQITESRESVDKFLRIWTARLEGKDFLGC